MATQHIKASAVTIRQSKGGFSLEISDAQPAPLWTKEECAKFLKVTPRTIESYIKRKNRPLPHTLVEGLLRFDEQEVRQWLKEKK